LLVTYAIELRADELYPIYQKILTETKSKVQVKSIIVEEEGHLEEMMAQLKATWPDWEQHAAVAVQIETELYQDWVSSLVAEVA
jgi:rubrerythrin